MQTVAAVIIIVSYWFWWWIVAPECGIYDGERLRYPYWITFENDQEIPEKGPNFRSHLGSKSYKVFSFRGASPPWPPDQGLCPWTPLGAPPPDPRYRLALPRSPSGPPLLNSWIRPWTRDSVVSSVNFHMASKQAANNFIRQNNEQIQIYCWIM